MMTKNHALRWLAAVGMFAMASAVEPAWAQQGEFGDFGGGIVNAFDPAGDTSLVTISSQFTAATAERPAVLMITASISPEWHIYAVTQPPGGPQPTKIRLTPSPQYRQIGPFRAFPQPKSHIDEVIWKGLEIQEHEGDVTWYAPIAISVDVDPADLEIEGTIEWQVCKESCIPGEAAINARLGAGVPIGPLDAYGKPADAGPLPEPTASGSYQAADSEVKLTGHLDPAVVRPGDSARLVITATPSPGWHVYTYSPYDNKAGTKPTLITFQTTSGLVPLQPTTDAIVRTDNSVPTFGPMSYYEGAVTWVTHIDVPASAPAGEYPIRGVVGFQACEFRDDGRGSCELAQAVHFQGKLQVGDSEGAAKSPLTFAAAKNYAEAALLATMWADLVDESPTATPPDPEATPTVRALDAYDLSRIDIKAEDRSLGYYIALAFVGGLILNLMPCVLPVIGLKVMSFVEQAGKSRTHAFVLNLWFAAGIVSVFLLLGVLAATIGLTWGGQNGKTPFNMAIAAIVFAMGLSLLGVWEIPIPGFFGTGSVQSAASKEGPLGAFLKGVITTILATPCTAPFMAAAIAWAVAQPVTTNIIVFATVGLGMASPYVLIGVYPELLRFLPKPGAWMETFKQVSGFILMGTVVFILSYIDPVAVVPTIFLLLGIGVACWLVARTPLTAEFTARLKSWTWSGAVVLLFMGASYVLYLLAIAPADKDWQPFSLERLKQVAVNEGRTVLVDFSAEWCVNCKFYEKTVLHTQAVKQAIKGANVVTMYADFTDSPPEIDRTIKALGANGVPVIAIFPGGDPYRPIVFRGGYSQQDIIAALSEANSRRSTTATADTR
ncbi:MAG: cytochrome c biogenesis protein CcdA [Pirellulales bacterium]